MNLKLIISTLVTFLIFITSCKDYSKQVSTKEQEIFSLTNEMYSLYKGQDVFLDVSKLNFAEITGNREILDDLNIKYVILNYSNPKTLFWEEDSSVVLLNNSFMFLGTEYLIICDKHNNKFDFIYNKQFTKIDTINSKLHLVERNAALIW